MTTDRHVWINNRIPIRDLLSQVGYVTREINRLQALQHDLEGQVEEARVSPLPGVSSYTIIAHVTAFPEGVDISIDLDAIRITFVPVLFTRRRSGSKRTFVTTPSRFAIHYQGDHLVKVEEPTVHPHVEGGDSICYGVGMERLFEKLASRNDILGVFEAIRRWRMGWNSRSEYDGDWASKAWHCILDRSWDEDTVQSSWDGDTVQRSPSGKIASLDSLLPQIRSHRGLLTHALITHYVPPDMFDSSIGLTVTDDPCSKCGRPAEPRLCGRCPINCEGCHGSFLRCVCKDADTPQMTEITSVSGTFPTTA